MNATRPTRQPKNRHTYNKILDPPLVSGVIRIGNEEKSVSVAAEEFESVQHLIDGFNLGIRCYRIFGGLKQYQDITGVFRRFNPPPPPEGP